jgi:nucleoside-triphosphatase
VTGPRVLFLTGAPGVGKTTLLRTLAGRLGPYKPAGFYTAEIRDGTARRVGFELVDLAGPRRILSHVRIRGPRIGKYGVDLPAFEEFLASVRFAAPETGLVIIDEIGKMECLSPRFRDLVTGLVDGQTPLVATIAARGDAFIEGLKARPGVRIVTVTRDNRDALSDTLPGEVLTLLGRDGSAAAVTDGRRGCD